VKQEKKPENELTRTSVERQILSSLGMTPARLQRDVDAWLEEDFGGGDPSVWTQSALGTRMRVEIVAKQEFILCGLPFMALIFQKTHGHIPVQLHSTFNDGETVRRGDIILSGEGDAAALLLGERVALNLAARLSGIANKTHAMKLLVERASARQNLGAPQLLETRKTTPGLRLYEKYATRVGGARNHRHALDTGLMLKENHLRSFGGVSGALGKARANAPILTRVEIEVSNLREFAEALEGGADVIMLDNFSVQDIQSAVELRKDRRRSVALEVSGNLTEENIAAVAQLGVDYLSSGALIHQATWVDMSLQLYPIGQK